MAAIAAFAESPSGILYARSCERYGVDPAAGLADEIEAANLRVALAIASVPESPPESAPDGSGLPQEGFLAPDAHLHLEGSTEAPSG